MAREERNWLWVLVVVAVLFNAITLSPLVPWQRWMLWSRPVAEQRVNVEMGEYKLDLPPGGIQVRAGKFVEFVATSRDVTYGFGVFRSDGTLVFQMQVVPGYANRMLWKFDQPGQYDIRSTEYSGPRHPEMYFKGALLVNP